MSEIIRFENINKKFGGITALEDITFGVEQNEILAVVGENGAGKSTLMNVLNGLFLPDNGNILFEGKQVRILNSQVSRSLGIAMVHQELKLCRNLNIVENMFLGHEIRRRTTGLDWDTMREQTRKMLENYQLDLSPITPMKELSAAQMQLVEIARAVSTKAKVLVLDEPTSSLTENETRRLFRSIRDLKSQGVTVIFISHRLEEVFEISERISIMRNGNYLGTFKTNEISPSEVIALIAGREIEEKHKEQIVNYEQDPEVVLEVENYSRGHEFHDISFKLYRNEMLGFYGLQGSGRTELIETIFGLNKADAGILKIFGEKCTFKTAKQAINKGLGLVTEDRKIKGIFPRMSVEDNIALVHKERIEAGRFFVSQQKIRNLANEYIEHISIKTDSPASPITSLSGGNQQKVVIARQLSLLPPILLMDEPTRGVDVGAKAEIFDLLHKLRKEEDKSIIVISSELSEIIAQCDRILVLRNGRIVGELVGNEINRNSILEMAFNG